MAVTATVALALWAFVVWLGNPDPKRSALLGFAFALAIVSKLSAIPFLGLSATAVLIAYSKARTRLRRSNNEINEPAPKWTAVLVAAAVAFVTMWATYRFSLQLFGGPIRPRFSGPMQSLYIAFKQTPKTGEIYATGHSNNGAFTAGGPVLIPKLVNGRNKLFFFGNYQANLDDSPARNTPTRASETIDARRSTRASIKSPA